MKMAYLTQTDLIQKRKREKKAYNIAMLKIQRNHRVLSPLCLSSQQAIPQCKVLKLIICVCLYIFVHM